MKRANEFMREYEKATNSHNLNLTLSMIDEDAIYFFSDESVHIGKDAIQKVLRRNFDLIKNEKYGLENITWIALSTEVASCVYDYSWSGKINGEFASGSGRGTSVLRYSTEGWLVVHEHLSRGKFA